MPTRGIGVIQQTSNGMRDFKLIRYQEHVCRAAPRSPRHHFLEPIHHDEDFVCGRLRVRGSEVHAAPVARDVEVLGSRYLEQRNRFLPRAAPRSRTAGYHHAPALAVVAVEEEQLIAATGPPRKDSALA